MKKENKIIMHGYSSPNFDDLWVTISFGVLLSIRASRDDLSTFILYFISLLLIFIFIHYGLRTKKVVVSENGMEYSPVILNLFGIKATQINWEKVNSFQFIRGYMKQNNFILFKMGKKKIRIKCSYTTAQKVLNFLKENTSVKVLNPLLAK